MITAAALCPQPPLLFRELSGHDDVAADLRAACHAVLRTVLATGPELVVVVGPADTTKSWDPSGAVDVRRFGTTGERVGSGLPLSLGVGARLLHGAGWTGPVELLGLAGDSSPVEVDGLAAELTEREERLALLVLADGSTRRGAKAPGYLDERAFGFDDATSRALAAGDAGALRWMDVALAAELMVLGRVGFSLLGAVALAQGTPPTAVLEYADDPFGVMYQACSWTF